MGGDVGKAIKKSVGVLTMPFTLPAAMVKHGGDFKKAVDDSYNLMSKGSEKEPQAQEAPDVTALEGAIEDEDARRRKKRGFAANVLTNEFRFGAGNNNTAGR